PPYPYTTLFRSNRQTHAIPALAAHPLRRLRDQGLAVTLSTDNWLMSDVTLSGEYALATNQFGLTAGEIRRLVLNAVSAAFLPLPERRALTGEMAAALDRWA